MYAELLEQLLKGATESSSAARSGIEQFLKLLSGEKQIVCYVDGTPNFGHQASTIHVLKRLIELCNYTGSVVVVYADGPHGRVPTTPQKLALLLTGLVPDTIDTQKIGYGSCNDITFLNYSKRATLQGTNLGFTAGADDLDVVYATELKTKFFLRLQPYMWQLSGGGLVPNRIEFLGKSKEEAFPLNDAVGLLAYKSDPQKVRNVPAGVWTWYTVTQTFDAALKQRTLNAQALVAGLATLKNYRLWPTYGLHHFDSNGRDFLLNIVVSGLAFQASLGFKGPPVIVLLMNEFDNGKLDFSFVEDFANDEIEKISATLKAECLEFISKIEQGARTTKIAQLEAELKKYYAALRPDQHFEVPDEIDPKVIKQAVETAALGELLIVPIGPVPQEIFDLFYAGAGMPPIFEGQGTSSLVISLGLPYLQTPKPGKAGNNYPSPPKLVLVPQDAIPRYCNDTSELFRIGLTNLLTNLNYRKTDYQTIIDATLKFINDAYAKNTELAAYFAVLGAYFQDDLNDKLLAAAIRLNALASGKKELLARARAPQIAAADQDLDLDAIYNALTDAWSDGSVDLLAALPDSYLAKFYSPIVGTSFPVVVDKDDIVAEQTAGQTTRVLLKNGTTNAFLVTFGVNLTFAAEFGPVTSELQCRATDPWAVTGAAWLGFDNPGFDMQVTEAEAPVTGGMVGTIHGTDLTLQIGYPVVDDQWVVTGTFATPYPGIAKFYQMAGGLNLVQSLPAPLNGLARFGLSECQFIYDGDKKSINYLMFVMTTDQPWVIVQTPLFQIEPTVRAIIQNPGDLDNREISFQITGQFTIGGGTITIDAQYPNFQVSGSLTDGTIVLNDLAKLFGVDVPALQNAEVTAFTLFVQPSTSSYEVGATIVSDWPIPDASNPIFTITGLGFNVQGATGSFAVTLSGSTSILPKSANIGVEVVAAYAAGKGWTFDGKTTTPILLGDLIKGYGGFDPGSQSAYSIDSLELHVVTGDGSWWFKGAASNWKIDFLDLTVNTATLEVGYNGTEDNALMHPLLGETSALMLLEDGDEKGHFANVDVDVTWAGIDITAWIKFSTSAGPSWGFALPRYHLNVAVTQNDQKQWVATGSLTDLTLGGMIEDLISFATGSSFGLNAPWNLLNSVPLDAFNLSFNFTTKEVSFGVDIGPIELGFCTINSINLNYDSSVLPRKVMVSIKGSFPWQSSDELKWDATQPDKAPSPPGGGNEFLDLRLLALGQHVAIKDETTFTSVQQAIAALRNLGPDDAPIAGPNGNVIFSADSSWLIGADFGVIKIKDEENNGGDGKQLVVLGDSAPEYVVNLAIIFNDPNLYGARIELAGAAAKILDGLAFEILYRKISDNIGVYQVDLTLPTAMRKFDVGAYSLTLPSIALAIYTNGDFTVDFGFPWNQDFSRSFIVQAIIPPGIPVMGAAGFYFGKLSSETSTQVPVATNGRFDPVIIFGFGITVGIGKSVDYGILKAGFQLTVFGIIQGVIAKFCPYPNAGNLPADKNQLQDSYYFELDGTFGIIGGLYGSVDFVVIKASVSVSLKVMAQITYISYQDIPISLIASVDVTASLSIDLGLFSITLHFSFSMTIKETFTIQNPQSKQTPPWHVAATSRPAMLARAHRRGLRVARQPHFRMLADDTVNFTWTNLAVATSKPQLAGYWAPALTVCGDMAGKPSEQQACYVNILAIASSDPTLPRASDAQDTPFDQLAVQVLRWIIAASLSKDNAPYSVATIDNHLVTPDDLTAVLDALAKAENPNSIQADDADAFMAGQFVLKVTLPNDHQNHDAAPFPAPPKLAIDVPKYGSTPELTYPFSDFNSASSTYLDLLTKYFDDLTIQVEKETSEAKAFAAAAGGPSVATFVFADYFRLIGRQMIEACRDALRSYKYALSNGASIDAAVKWINAAGAAYFTYADLLEANPDHALSDSQNVRVYGAAGQTGNNATFTSIATAYSNLFSPQGLAVANATATALLTPGATITYKNTSYTVVAGDSLNDVAAHVGATLADLLANAPAILDQAGLIQNNVAITVPGGATSQAAEGATFKTIAAAYQNRFSKEALAVANAASTTLLAAGQTIKYPNQPDYPTQARDTLASIATHFGVSLAAFLQNAPAVLDQPGLIATFAQLVLPDISYTTNSDTPNSIAQRFGVAVSNLATAANAGVTFTTDVVATLDCPHLGQLKVSALIDDIRRTNGLSRISGMTGRYALHGLRLPTGPGLTPNYPCTCSSPAEDCGLYALTGQQIAVPPLTTANGPFSFSLVGGDNLPWIDLGGPKLTLTLSPPSKDNVDKNWQMVTSLQAYFANSNYSVVPPDTTVGPEQIYRDQPTTWPATSVTPWQSAGSVTLPYGTPPSGVQALRLWGLPDSLVNLDDDARAAPPCALPTCGTYDEGTGQTVERQLTYYGWATRVGLTIKRIPSSAQYPSSAFTYQLIGCGEADIVLLERLLAVLKGSSAPVGSLVLLYPPDASSGAPAALQSDNAANVTLGILQANLSTVTNPPTLAAGARRAAQATANTQLNSAYDFVKLLWECSITRSGGYYLYYADTVAGAGFPGTIFNDKGEASLTLLAVYTRPSDVTKRNLIAGFVNCLITGESFDTTKSAVYAKSAPAATTYQAGNENLAAIAYRFYMDPIALAEANPDAALAAHGSVKLARGIYTVGTANPGGDPATIAQYFGTTVPAVQAANPQITNWNPPLALYTVVRLPTLQLTIGTSPGGSTLTSLASYYGSSVAEIAADNADVPGLFAAQQLAIPGGPMSRSATVPPGCIAIAASRKQPQSVPDPSDPNFAPLFMLSQIVLLGYGLTKTAWFDDTNPGLPISHSDEPASDLAADRTRTPLRAAQADTFWDYQRAIPAAQNADPRSTSPYAGVGGIAQLDLGWVDAFGNTVKSQLGTTKTGTPTPNRPSLPLNYIDALIGLGQWPSINADYRVFTPSGGGAPTISITLSFDPSAYSPSANLAAMAADQPAWQVNAARALDVYDRLNQQLSQLLGPTGNQTPAVTFAIDTSLLPSRDLTLDAATRQSLMDWLFVGQNSVYAFLVARKDGNTGFPAPADHPIAVTFNIADINPAQLYKLSTTLTLSRPQTLVDPAFSDTAGFVSATTVVAPHLVKESDGIYRLTSFADDLEQCLTQTGAFACKLASGVDREQVTQAGEAKPLWLVRLGLADQQAINFRIADPLKPLIYAPRPLYNTLQSRPSVNYYNYVSGKGIDFSTPSGTQPLTAIDVDGWMRDILAAIDTAFSPEFLTPVALVDQFSTIQHSSWRKQLRDAKQSLADSLSHLVIPFFTDEDPDKAQTKAAQTAFKEQALIALSNVYTVNAVVQFSANVVAAIDDPDAQEPPQLYGKLLAGTDSDPGASLTAGKLPLSTTQQGSPAPLTFLVMATGKSAQGAVEDKITLDLTFRGSQIEHQIGTLPNIENYTASSWLSFVSPPKPGATDWPLDAQLGPFEVPLALRMFPSPPSMVSQDPITHPLGKNPTWQDVVKALSWDYAVTYAETFHYPQDKTHFTTTFNVIDGRLLQTTLADPVPSLFEFITAYPQVQVDLVGILAGITQASGQDQIDKAAVALKALAQLVENAATALAAFLPAPTDLATRVGIGATRARVGAPLRGQGPYEYTIMEGATVKTNPNGTDVTALLVGLDPAPPAGIATPYVNIAGYAYQSSTPPPNFDYGFCYTSNGDYLTAADGQRIAQRTVVLPGLDILAAQSALTSAYIQRNQDLIPGRETNNLLVYQTAPAAFPTALRPTIDIPNPIDIASFGGNNPVARTFAAQLDNLLTVLFAKAPPGPQTVQVAVSYTVSLNDALPDIATVPVPILFLPPTAFQPQQAPALHALALGDDPLSQAELIATLRSGVYAWFAAYEPLANGNLVFNLTIMTSLQGAGLPPMPLLVLEQLTLGYAYWTDHPALPERLPQAAE